MKNWKIDRIVSIATLVVAVSALILVLKKPAAVAPAQTPVPVVSSSQSSTVQLAQPVQSQAQSAGASTTLQQTTAQQMMAPPAASQSGASQPLSTRTQPTSPRQDNTHISPDELSTAIAQAAGAIPGASGQLSPSADLGSMPPIKDQQVTFDGDTVHGRFLTTIAGKDVWITISGHLGEKDGYATFDPTEFKVGDIDVPVSLVNGPLQRQLAEQRDKMKIPD
jgi:hypothetical protein